MSKIYKAEEDPEGLTQVPSKKGEIEDNPAQAHDAVFGDITEDGPNYRNVRAIRKVVLTFKN